MKEQSPYIEIKYRTLKDLQSPDFWDLFIELINKHQKEFNIKGQATSHADNPRYKPIEKEEILKTVNYKEPYNSAYICFGGNKPYYFKINFNIQDGAIVRNRYNFSFIDVKISRQYFIDGNKSEKINNWLILCTDLYCLFEPLCAFSHDYNDYIEIISGSHADQPCLDCPIMGVFWANFFGPGCVDYFGKDKLLKAPGITKKEELEDGGVLILTAPDPLEPNNPQNEKNQYDLWKYLGLTPLPKRGKAGVEISFKNILKLPEIISGMKNSSD